MKQLKKTLLTLVALLAVTTGAWADETPLVTITFDSNGPVYSESGIVTLTGTNYHLGNSSGVYFWEPNSPTKTLSATVEAVADNVSISKVVFRSLMVGGNDVPLEDTEKPFVCYANADKGGRSLSETDWTGIKSYERIAKIDVYAGSASAATPVDIAWDAATPNIATIAKMPAGNVTVSVEYYGLATLAFQGLTAAEDAAAKTEAPLAVVADGAVTGGTLMYYVATDGSLPAKYRPHKFELCG